jgi:CheY-like chemotaxis protein
MKRWPFTHKTKILAVDDEIGFTRLFKLAAPQYEIRTENDPTRALEAAREFAPDIILLDRHMPRLCGDRLAATLRADPELRHIPIAFVTGSVPQDEDGRFCTELDGLPVLSKPVSIEAIDQLVRTHVKAG